MLRVSYKYGNIPAHVRTKVRAANAGAPGCPWAPLGSARCPAAAEVRAHAYAPGFVGFVCVFVCFLARRLLIASGARAFLCVHARACVRLCMCVCCVGARARASVCVGVPPSVRQFI